MINNVNNSQAVMQTSYTHKKPAAKSVKTLPAIDQIYISGEAIDMESQKALREELAQNGFNFRFAVIDSENGTSVRFIVTPSGIWKTGENGFSTKVDIEQGVEGIEQTTLYGLKHLTLMLRHLQPEHDEMRLSLRQTIANLQLGEYVDKTDPKEALENQLRQLTNAFGAMREEFGNTDQYMQYSQAAFRILLSSTMGLTGRLVRINLGGQNAALLDIDDIEKLQEQAQQKINDFADKFLKNFERLGAQGAFDVAWDSMKLT
ncbi:MAG: hypothetical protein FWE44_04040 [Defluviitaleaceae bacterium]|nr:hypothetical protein [Defluviitaleaceae bacterium]